jgi:hypothetical protein
MSRVTSLHFLGIGKNVKNKLPIEHKANQYCLA